MALSPFGFKCSTADGNGETFAELRRCAKEGYRSYATPEDLGLRIWIDGRKFNTLARAGVHKQVDRVEV